MRCVLLHCIDVMVVDHRKRDKMKNTATADDTP